MTHLPPAPWLPFEKKMHLNGRRLTEKKIIKIKNCHVSRKFWWTRSQMKLLDWQVIPSCFIKRTRKRIILAANLKICIILHLSVVNFGFFKINTRSTPLVSIPFMITCLWNQAGIITADIDWICCHFQTLARVWLHLRNEFVNEWPCCYVANIADLLDIVLWVLLHIHN